MIDPNADLRTLIREGGAIMAPLIVCSIVATAVALERAIALLGERRKDRRLAAQVLELARNGRLADAAAVAARSRAPVAEVLLAGLERRDQPDRAEAAIERARAAGAHDLKRGLWVLGTIGSVAPFVGLFGTVLGIIKSFREIAATGQGGFATVAAGISEALIATGAGIFVAVLAYFAHNYFQVRTSGSALAWRLWGEELVDVLITRERQSGTRP